MHKDIALTGNTEHHTPFLWPITGIQAMLPQATGEGIVRVRMEYITGHG